MTDNVNVPKCTSAYCVMYEDMHGISSEKQEELESFIESNCILLVYYRCLHSRSDIPSQNNATSNFNPTIRAILLSSVGSQTYSLIRNLLSPAKPGDKSYDDLVNLLKEHFNSNPVK